MLTGIPLQMLIDSCPYCNANRIKKEALPSNPAIQVKVYECGYEVRDMHGTNEVWSVWRNCKHNTKEKQND